MNLAFIAYYLFCLPVYDLSSSTHQVCYSHSWSDVQLQNVPIIDYEHTSRSTCRAHCSASEFAYYALEFGFICSCGDKLPDESRAVTNAACSLVRDGGGRRGTTFIHALDVAAAVTTVVATSVGLFWVTGWLPGGRAVSKCLTVMLVDHASTA